MAKTPPLDPDPPVDPDARTGSEARDRRNTATSPDVPAVSPALGTRGAPRAAVAPVKPADLPVLEGYPDTGKGLQEVTLDGGGQGNGAVYRVGKPIPQDLVIGSDIYNISDRAKGLYTYRVK